MAILAEFPMPPDPPLDRTAEAFRAAAERQADDRRRSADSPLHVASRLLHAAARDLQADLHDSTLPVAYFKSAGTRLGHYGRLVQSLTTRACLRCWEPLYSAEERLSGLCAICLANRRAETAIAAGQDGGR